jgi:hypothetical protein
MDREKVIKELHDVRRYLENKEWSDRGASPHIDAINDALALLKEQEAVEPILEQDSMVCGVCGHEVIWQKMIGDGIWVDEELEYCPHCGQAVKWDD